MQADVEGLSRAFFDEGAHGGYVDGFGAELAAPRLKVLELFVTARQENGSGREPGDSNVATAGGRYKNPSCSFRFASIVSIHPGPWI